ncbi:general secretion pathway protein GspC [Paraburkholderia phosphatilytica]|uniref:general secretion pathway protein GspC n=1 Tax=Paraburkholderia phosphatilytica TaxID=2282883 RepID=UPI00198091FE|nr:general secretion pathway protein GspC [Paraburkholderia phosphatilytica]
MLRMNALQVRLLSLALFVVFCVTVAYWAVTLSSTPRGPLPAAAAHSELPTDQASTLFGGQLQRAANQDIHLFGVLALQGGAAAIISTGGEPPHAVSLGGSIMQGTTLSEVRARSIVIDRHGVHSEIFLPANGAGPTIYVR